MDPNPHSYSHLGPGGKKMKNYARKNASKLVINNNCNFIKNFKVNLDEGFFTLKQSLYLFHQQKIFISYFFTKFLKAGSGSTFKKQLDPDPHWKKQLDPFLQNADPQPLIFFGRKIILLWIICSTKLGEGWKGSLDPVPGEGEQQVTADAGHHRQEDPGDVPPRLVDHQAQQRRGGGRHQVYQTWPAIKY